MPYIYVVSLDNNNSYYIKNVICVTMPIQ